LHPVPAVKYGYVGVGEDKTQLTVKSSFVLEVLSQVLTPTLLNVTLHSVVDNCFNDPVYVASVTVSGG
jgi:hypothetical protein